MAKDFMNNPGGKAMPDTPSIQFDLAVIGSGMAGMGRSRLRFESGAEGLPRWVDPAALRWRAAYWI